MEDINLFPFFALVLYIIFKYLFLSDTKTYYFENTTFLKLIGNKIKKSLTKSG